MALLVFILGLILIYLGFTNRISGVLTQVFGTVKK